MNWFTDLFSPKEPPEQECQDMTSKDECSPTTPNPRTEKDQCRVQLTGYVECCCPPPPVVRKECVRWKRVGNCDDSGLDAAISAFLSQYAGMSILGFNVVDLDHHGWLLSVRVYCDELAAGK